MLNFFISIVVFAASTFLLALGIRYGMMGAERLDSWIQSKSGRNYDGFDWYYRIPFTLGAIPEYFYAMVLGKPNYFKTNWWALKTSSFLSVLLFIGILHSRSAVASYYSLKFLGETGIQAFFTSGTFIWYLNFITLTYVALAVLVLIESIKMGGLYGLLRAAYYGLFCLLMANLTMAVLSLIVFVALIYFAYKIIKFLFFSDRKNRSNQTEDEESVGDIFNKGFSEFRPDLADWEASRKSHHRSETKPKTRRKPIITRSKAIVKEHDDSIPRLHPD